MQNCDSHIQFLQMNFGWPWLVSDISVDCPLGKAFAMLLWLYLSRWMSPPGSWASGVHREVCHQNSDIRRSIC